MPLQSRAYKYHYDRMESSGGDDDDDEETLLVQCALTVPPLGNVMCGPTSCSLIVKRATICNYGSLSEQSSCEQIRGSPPPGDSVVLPAVHLQCPEDEFIGGDSRHDRPEDQRGF